MNPSIIFWGVFMIMLLIIWLCNKYFNLLKDVSDAAKKPYSYSRVQLAYWTIIVLSCFITIYFVSGQIPVFNESSLILLGISAGTTVAASMIDVSDQSKGIKLSQDTNGDNLLLDILSDGNGVSIHRLQTVLFNLVFGAWFIETYIHNLDAYFLATRGVATALTDCTNCMTLQINQIIPVMCPNNLILLGVSSGTYAALKTSENKPGMKSGGGTPPMLPPAAPVQPPLNAAEVQGGAAPAQPDGNNAATVNDQ